MELNPPNLLAGICGRLDTLDGGVVAVDERGLPSSGEGIFQLQGVLMVLAKRGY